MHVYTKGILQSMAKNIELTMERIAVREEGPKSQKSKNRM
jgi:hypothetical protein